MAIMAWGVNKSASLPFEDETIVLGLELQGEFCQLSANSSNCRQEIDNVS